MRSELAQLQEKVGVTFLIVTHDQDEALAMASRCAVMNRGLLQQVATPSTSTSSPSSRFVADFIGQVNLFEGRLAVDEPDHAVVEAPELAAPVYPRPRRHRRSRDHRLGRLAPREDRAFHHPSPRPPTPRPAATLSPGSIRQIAYLGSESIYDVELAGGRLVKALRSNLTRRDQEDLAIDDPVWLTWHAAAPAVLLS